MKLAKEFRKFDSSDMFGHIYGFPQQLESAIEIGRSIELSRRYRRVNSVVFSGMGGSAIGGDVVMALSARSSTVPMVVTRNYSLPNWVNQETLVICISYSGNTEETLSCFDDAADRKAMIIGITSGGELEKRLANRGADIVEIPGGYPPRASVGFLSVPAFLLLHKTGVIQDAMESEWVKTASHLMTWRDKFCEAKEENPTYKVARRIYDSVPLIYGQAGGMSPVALRWRGQLAENGKIVAFHHALPEMNHNEIVGFENNPELLKRLGVIWLIDKDDHPGTVRRRRITRDIIGESLRYQLEVKSRGNSIFERFFYLIYFGDWVSFWVAMLHETDPTPVTKIEMLKGLMANQKGSKGAGNGVAI